ncbi:MAG TPA: LacI family DNA-binding transcriptional regulator [Chloroflexia bacterium]|nr:LacI family DNA-binding transcriptional regulator [Chloroflexia bacterium]
MYEAQRTTIKQVAFEAGVSTQTVSRVINSRPDVSQETRLRVQQVIDRLAYQPSAVARSLIRKRTHTIGVVGSGLEYFGPSSTLAGIEKQAGDLGFSVLLVLLHEPETEDLRPVLADMMSRQVEGIIWAAPEIAANRSWIDNAEQPIIPIVFLTMKARPGLPVVTVNNRAGGRLATQHLLEQGRRHIGLVTGPLTWWEARERRQGWEEALTGAGLAVQAHQIAEGNWSPESGELAFTRLRAQFPGMDAVFASNDQMAQGVLHAAWKENVRVPADLAVVGFDDIPEAAYFIPPLTTIRQETNELGRAAVRVLDQLITARRETGPGAAYQPVSLEPRLIVRASSVL